MASALSMEPMETPNNHNSTPIPAAPVSLVPDNMTKHPDIIPAGELTEDDAQTFIGKYATHIVTELNLLKALRGGEVRLAARAKLVGEMFGELGMFGQPPPETVPPTFTHTLRRAEEDAAANSVMKLYTTYEEHPVIAALDAAEADAQLSSQGHVDAIQMLRGSLVLMNAADNRSQPQQ